MADIAFVSVLIAFFALALLLVRVCEHVIGSDEQAVPATGRTPAPKQDLAV